MFRAKSSVQNYDMLGNTERKVVFADCKKHRPSGNWMTCIGMWCCMGMVQICTRERCMYVVLRWDSVGTEERCMQRCIETCGNALIGAKYCLRWCKRWSLVLWCFKGLGGRSAPKRGAWGTAWGDTDTRVREILSRCFAFQREGAWNFTPPLTSK